MPQLPHKPQRFLTRLPLDSWAVAIATAFLVLIIAGVLPRVPW